MGDQDRRIAYGILRHLQSQLDGGVVEGDAAESLSGTWFPLDLPSGQVFNSLSFIHMYTRTHIHMYTRTYIRTYVHTYAHTYIHAHIRTVIHSYIRTYMYIHMYMHTHIYVHTYTYMHTYITLPYVGCVQ